MDVRSLAADFLGPLGGPPFAGATCQRLEKGVSCVKPYVIRSKGGKISHRLDRRKVGG